MGIKVKNALGLFAVRGFIVGLNFVTMLILAALLPSEEFGRFVYLWALARVISAIANMGGPPYLLRECSARQGDPSRGVTHLEMVKIAVMWPILILTGIFISVNVVPSTIWSKTGLEFVFENILILIAVAWGVAITFHSAIVYRLNGKMELAMFIRDGLPNIIIILVAIFTMIVGMEITAKGILLTFFIVTVLTIFGLLLYALKFENLFWRDTTLSLSRAPGQLYFWGNGLLGIITSQIDILLGGIFLSSVDIGRYQILRRLVNLVSLPQVIANWLTIVRVGKSYAAKDLSDVQEACKTGIIWAFLPGIAMLIVIFIATPFVGKFYGLESGVNLWATVFFLSVANIVSLACGMNLTVASQCGKEFYAMISRLIGVTAATIIILMFSKQLNLIWLSVAVCAASILTNTWLSGILFRSIKIHTSILSFSNRGRKLL